MNDSDILLIDKPKGITSFDVIRLLRKKMNIRKMGHAGTLDPLASGLMIIGVGPGTKKLADLIKLDKTYEAEILIGEQRTTGDLEGEIISEVAITELDMKDRLSKEKVTDVLNSLIGSNDLPVPIYSAIKRGGEALYKKARRGEDVDLPLKTMTVNHFVLNKIIFEDGDIEKGTPPRVRIFVVFDVGSGTYIRTLAEELGRRLNFPATLGNLRRTRVGDFYIEDAVGL